MIFGNDLKKFDFARQNLDGRAKCLAQKNEEKKHWSAVLKYFSQLGFISQLFDLTCKIVFFS